MTDDPEASRPSSGRFVDALGDALFPDGGGLPLPRSTLARIVETYDTTQRRAGNRPASVLWKSRASQRQRFRKLLGVLGRDRWRSGLVINDYGCGYGALFDMIRRSWFLRGGRYQGFDICPRMIRAARQHVTDPRAVFIEAAAPTLMADYTFCSGTFGLRLDTPDDAWTAYIQAALRDVADHSRRGFAFNLLRKGAGDEKSDLFYAEPEVFVDFCRATFGGTVRLIDDYAPADFTIRVRF